VIVSFDSATLRSPLRLHEITNLIRNLPSSTQHAVLGPG
jgi:hypothetical protein